MGFISTITNNRLAVALLVIVLGGIGALATWQWGHYELVWNNDQDLRQAKTHISGHDVKFSELDTVAQSVLSELKDINRKQELFIAYATTQVGRATVSPIFDAGVHLNRAGKVEKFDLFERQIKITRIDDPQEPSVVADIVGDFRNSDEGHILIMGKDIANRLQIPDGQTVVRVKVERP